ncbi:hypothetical protein [Metabacillus litoralis]|uniref:hypothetical protein n=1 Tax=Metabacillus litoralis TaxID=152268 RepID=UPI001CFEA085|nr:hypothetical protein [Metabacillus litoralis]
MKHFLLFLMCVLMTFSLFGCSSQRNHSFSTATLEEKSWAYEFVIVNNTTYEVTNKKVDEASKGDKIGEVKRNIVDYDVNENLTEMDFDSNSLNIGTQLYYFIEDEARILFEKEGEFFVAVKRYHN